MRQRRAEGDQRRLCIVEHRLRATGLRIQVGAHVQASREHRVVGVRLGVQPVDRFAEQGQRPLPLVLVAIGRGEQAVDVAEQPGTARAARRCLRTQQHRLRLFRLQHVAVLDADHQLQSAPARRIVGELLVGELFGARQQLRRRQRRRVALTDEKAHQVVRRAGIGEVAQRVVALDLRLGSLLLGAPRLGDGADQAGDDGHQRQGAAGHGGAVTRDEARRAIAERWGACGDRLAGRPAAQVLVERVDRRIALARRLAKGLGDDDSEIAAKLPLQPAGRRAARRGDGREVDRRRLSAGAHRRREKHRFAFQRCSQQVGRRRIRRGRGMPARQQLVEQDAERVDVGGRRDRFAP